MNDLELITRRTPNIHLYSNETLLETYYNNDTPTPYGTSNDTHNLVITLWWQDFLTYSQLFMVITGFFAKLATVITLFKNGKAFSVAIMILLQHQSAADAAACFFSAVLIIAPNPSMLSGIYVIDVFICYAWQSQAIFWSSLLLSIWNLVLLAIERYFAVCHPFKHQELTAKRVHFMILGIYFLVVVIHWPNYYESELQGDVCTILPPYQKGVWLIIQYYFAVSSVSAFYFIPCALFVFLYGKIILTFYTRQKNSSLATSRVIDKATSELTKTAIVVTLILILTLGCNMWYILLGITHAIKMVHSGPLHMISVWLASLNSIANPFVYTLLMPAYRNSVQQTFFPCNARNIKKDNIPKSK